VATVRPALSALGWSHGINNADYLTKLATRLRYGLPVGPVAVVGHSAGAAAGSWLAAEFARAGLDVRALILVDGVESPAGLMRRAWPRLAGVPVRALCAPPSRCNREGQLEGWLANQEGDVQISVLPGMGHGDIEGVPSRVYAWACREESSPETRRLVIATVADWVVEAVTPNQ
jgi:surfactin synthase thioesterase subunit